MAKKLTKSKNGLILQQMQRSLDGKNDDANINAWIISKMSEILNEALDMQEGDKPMVNAAKPFIANTHPGGGGRTEMREAQIKKGVVVLQKGDAQRFDNRRGNE